MLKTFDLKKQIDQKKGNKEKNEAIEIHYIRTMPDLSKKRQTCPVKAHDIIYINFMNNGFITFCDHPNPPPSYIRNDIEVMILKAYSLLWYYDVGYS